MIESQHTIPEMQIGIVEAFLQSLAHATDDFGGALNHRTPIYSLDFSLLFPILFNAPASEGRASMLGSKELMEGLVSISHGGEPYFLAVGGPTYLEFLEQLISIERTVTHRIPDISRHTIERQIRENFLQTSSQLLGDLGLLTADGARFAIRMPAEKFANLLSNGVLHGLGDYLKAPSRVGADVSQQFADLYDAQEKRRAGWDSRSPIHRAFHYRMDAANICLTLLFSKDTHSRTLLVSPSGFVLGQCRTADDLLGRSPFVPLFIKNATRLKAAGYCGDVLKFLSEGVRAAEAMRNKLLPYRHEPSLDKVPVYVRRELNAFYEVYCLPLENLSDSLEVPKGRVITEELKEILHSRKRTRERIDAAVAEIDLAANLLSSHVSKLGLDFLKEFGLDEDPIYRKIKQRFHIL